MSSENRLKPLGEVGKEITFLGDASVLDYTNKNIFCNIIIQSQLCLPVL
jgi:hypothetical protein